jgi:hyperosmotically inducible protein
MKLFYVSTMAVAIAMALGTTGAFAQERNLRFEKFDANGDGLISRDELKGHRWYDRAFDRADDNKDGLIDRNEFVKLEANQDRTSAGNHVADANITARIKAGIIKNQKLKALDINVETLGGEVQLSGFIHNEAQRQNAVAIAKSVRGVHAVNDALIVR